MLAIDSSLTHIDADSAEITRVYKSAAPLTVSVAGLPSEVCEAYVCVIRKNDLIRVHAGLATGGNRLFIYSPEQQPGTEAALAGVLKEAVSFIEAMGFSMEELNLNYSPAMRAVVMRDIKVLRPPRTTPKPPARKASPPVTKKHSKTPEAPPALEKIAMRESSAQQDLGQEVAAPAAPAAPPAPAVGTEELATLRGALVRLTTERAAAEQAAGALLAAAREELEQAKAERDDLAESLAAREEEAARLATDLKTLGAEKTAAEKKQQTALLELRDRLAERDSDLDRLQGEKTALQKARDELADALRKEEEAHRAARKEARQAEDRLSEDLSQARTARDELDAGHGKALDRLTGELEAARAELERATAQKISAEQLAKQQAELAGMAAAELAGLNNELAQLATEKIAAEELAAQQTAMARATAADLAAAKAELARLAEETAGKSKAREKVADTVAPELEEPTTAPPAETVADMCRAEEPAAEQEEPAQPATVEAVQPTVAVEAPQPAAVEAVLSAPDEPAELESVETTVEPPQSTEPAAVEAPQSEAVKTGLPEAIEPAEPAKVEPPPSESVEQPAATVATEVAATREVGAGTVETKPTGTAEETPDKTDTLLKEELDSLRVAQSASEKMLRELAALQQRTLEELAAAKQALSQAADVQKPPVQSVAEPAGTTSGPGRPEPLLPPVESGPRPHAPEPEQRFTSLMTPSPPALNSVDGVVNIFASTASAAPTVAPPSQPGTPAGRAPIEFPPEDETSYFGSETSTSGFFADGGEDFSPTLQPGVEEIVFEAGAELIALYQSINVVRLVQGGEAPQGSKGFVCAVRDGEALRVYAAIFLLERERAFIYAPQTQPQDDATLGAALRSALDFAEMTGFMMDETDLKIEQDRLARTLAKVPVLRQLSAN